MLRRKSAATLAGVSRCDKVKSSSIPGDSQAVEKLVEELERSALAGEVIGCNKFAGILRECGEAKALAAGKRVHGLISSGELKRDRFLGNLLVQMYGKCSSPVDARGAFEKIIWRNSFSWSSMIAAYAQNSLISEACFLFDRMPQRDLVCWTGMISAYAQAGRSSEALGVFRSMDLEGLQADPAAILTVLDSCRSASDVRMLASSISETELESDVKVATAVITSFGRCSSVSSAEGVFYRMPERNLVTWNAMIGVFAQNGQHREAMRVFRSMDLEGFKPNYVTIISILESSSSSSSLEDGRFIHGKAMESGIAGDRKVASALVNMYGKCASVDEARGVFDATGEKNVVTWSAMVAAYAQNDRGREALHVAMLMDLNGLLPNEVTMVSVVDACAGIPALREGRLVHDSVQSDGPLLLELANALVHMYGNCGDVDAAWRVFLGMEYRDRVSWNAMIAAFADNDLPSEALELYLRMKNDGAAPSQLTFTSVFSACSQSGMPELARGCFLEMLGDFGMSPEPWHYSCILDLLGRGGRFPDAEELLRSMPYEPSAPELRSVLGGCRTHGNVRGGAQIGRQMLLELEDDRPGTYILLSNMWREEP